MAEPASPTGSGEVFALPDTRRRIFNFLTESGGQASAATIARELHLAPSTVRDNLEALVHSRLAMRTTRPPLVADVPRSFIGPPPPR